MMSDLAHIRSPTGHGEWRGKSTPARWTFTPVFTSLMLSMALMLMVGLMATAGAVLIARPGTVVDNPIVVYSSLLRRPLDILAAGSYRCDEPPAQLSVRRCLVNASRSVGEVYLLVTRSTVEQILGVLSADRMRLGDLIAAWGQPVVRQNARGVSLSWCRTGSYRVDALSDSTAGRVTYFLPIKSVVVSRVTPEWGCSGP